MDAVPAGYAPLRLAAARAVVLSELAAPAREILNQRPLYEWAAAQPGAQAMAGRGTTWGVRLAGTDVAVRRNRHGGTFGAITGDLFIAPRAASELSAALRLAQRGVRTPRVIAYALYPVLWGTWRSDVITERLRGADFPDAWRAADENGRTELLDALAELLAALQAAGAYHADLNLKNVFVGGNTAPVAYALDVDRVEFGAPHDAQIGSRNLNRLLRSARKWRDKWSLDISETHLRYLGESVARACETVAP